VEVWGIYDSGEGEKNDTKISWEKKNNKLEKIDQIGYWGRITHPNCVALNINQTKKVMYEDLIRLRGFEMGGHFLE
jgi:hypothetical protein